MRKFIHKSDDAFHQVLRTRWDGKRIELNFHEDLIKVRLKLINYVMNNNQIGAPSSIPEFNSSPSHTRQAINTN